MKVKTWVCSVCGYVYKGEVPPEECPVCHAPADKFVEQEEEMTWAAEHVIGVASDVREDIKEDLRANFQGECTEVGMYLAMSRAAYREGYPEAVFTAARSLDECGYPAVYHAVCFLTECTDT